MNYKTLIQLNNPDYINSYYQGHQKIIDELHNKSKVRLASNEKKFRYWDVEDHFNMLILSLNSGFYVFTAIIITLIQLIFYLLIRFLKMILFSSKIYYILIYPLAYIFYKSCEFQAWCYLHLEHNFSITEKEKPEYYKKFNEANNFIIWETFHK